MQNLRHYQIMDAEFLTFIKQVVLIFLQAEVVTKILYSFLSLLKIFVELKVMHN